jgi:glycosyltransferase involved in cell wall biosynthesis
MESPVTHEVEGRFLVVFTHPGKQGTIYEYPASVRNCGTQVLFLNGLYYKDGEFPYSLLSYLPQRIAAPLRQRLAKARSHPGLLPEEVISLTGPWLEMAARPLRVFGVKSSPFVGFVDADIIFDRIAARFISRFHPQNNASVIVNGFMNSCLETIQAAKQRGFLTVLDITLPLQAHEIVNAERKRLGLYTRPITSDKRQMTEIEIADHVFVHSNFSFDSILQCGKPPHRIHYVGFGSNPDRFRPAPERKRSDKIQALFVGQISIRKGVHILLEAWHSLKPTNAELLLVGIINDKDIKPWLAKYRNTCRLLGYVSHETLEQLYQKSHFLVFPSLAEGGSNVVNEAMAAGLPAIVTPNSCSVVENGTNGFVIPLSDVAALAEAIKRLIDSPTLLADMSVNARKKALENTWNAFGERRCEAYRRILGQAKLVQSDDAGKRKPDHPLGDSKRG